MCSDRTQKHNYTLIVLALIRLKTIFQYLLFFLIVAVATSAVCAQQARFQITSPLNAEPISIHAAAPDSTQEWIVVFSSSVVNKMAQSGIFEQDLRTAVANYYGPSKLAQTWVTPLPLINGASFSAPNRVIPALLAHSYVEYIDYNHEVEINPTAQIDIDIGAKNKHFAKPGPFTGKGVIIAIIDTGVDYTHPDLGGCLGVECRVVGGYDIVDDDPDPFDEHGHGTHVAGIAAGTGLSSGIAQGAKILAYRALNEFGSGTMANVIEAIQRAVNDGANIINMSLGARGIPLDNPLNLAVREAVNMGVLVVASAGNNGPQWGTISSPGSERLALTVGAVDADGIVARFSSHGPVRTSFELKPDISAPGVGINSAIPGGRHIQLSGTSMAAPYVAGLAALVWEMMPQSDVLSIRSRIIQSARTTTQSIWASGLGAASADVTTYSPIGSYPTSISLKVADTQLSGGLQYFDDMIAVWNFSDFDRSAYLSAKVPVGVTIQLQQSATIPAFGKVDIPIRLHIDPTMVSFPTEIPPVYLGSIRAITNSDTLDIPIIVARPSELTLEFVIPPSLVVVHDRNGGYDFKGNPGRTFTMQVGAGLYDIWAIRDADATKWVLEDVFVRGATMLKVLDTDARNTLRYDLTDPDGVAIGACGYSREYLSHIPSNLGLMYQYQRSCPEVPTQIIQHQISSFSPDVLYEVSHVAYGSLTHYEYLRYLIRFDGGIHGNMLIRKGGADFRPVKWRYWVPPGVSRISFTRFYENIAGNSYNPPSWLRNVFQKPYTRTEFIVPNPNGGFAPFRSQYDKIFHLEADQFDPDLDAVFMITPSVYLTPTDTLVLRLPEVDHSTTWKVPYRGQELVLGAGPDSWSAGSMIVADNEIRIPTKNSWFLGWYRELRMGDLELEIVDPNGGSILNRKVRNGLPTYGSFKMDDWISVRTAGDGYSLNLTRSDTYLRNRQQTTSISLSLSQTTIGVAQSCIDRITLIDALGNPIQVAQFSSGISIVIESTSCDLIPILKIDHWFTQKSFTLSGSATDQDNTRTIRYDLPDGLEAGYVDITISLHKNGEQLFEQRVSPALLITHAQHVQDPPASPSLLHPSARQFVFDSQAELVWDAIDSVLLYRAQLSQSSDFTDVVTDTLIDKATIRLPVYGYGKVWYWRVMAKNEHGWGPWSQRRSFISVIESTSLEDETVPQEWALYQNFPNPFNPTTNIQFGVGATEHVRIEVFSITGQHIKSIDMGVLKSGKHSIVVDLSRMASGLYLYQVITPSFRQSRKMTLVK